MTGSPLYQFFYGTDSLNHRLFMLINHADLPLLDMLMPLVTQMGGSRMFYLYFLLLAACCLVNRRAMPARYLTVYLMATLLALASESLLKELFHVPRPPFAMGVESVRLLAGVSTSYSLPSGHATFSAMTAAVLGHGRGVGWKLPFWLFAFLVAYSRIYLGVHYPLDVLAGLAVGALCGLGVWWVVERFFRSRRHA